MKPKISQLIHALLFTTGETWRFSELVKTLSVPASDIEDAINELSEEMKDQAIIPLIHEQTITLVTQPELKDFLQSLEEAETTREFSKGALESLALIAYKGPISKSDIDYIRGVNSQFMLRNLVMRGMIEKQSGSKDRNAGYVITADALRFLGVTDRDQLPHFEQFFQEIEKRVPTNNVTEE